MEIELFNIKYEDIISNTNIKFKSNSINSIIGLGGSGKTILLKLIHGTIIPSDGEIRSDKYKINKDLCMVYQNSEEQIINITVEEEIGFYLDYYNYRKDTKEKHIKDALKMVGLDNSYLKRNPFTLSVGEMKLVTIASVLALNPKVILFDEPTVGLDYKAKKNLIKIIRLLKNRYHKTIILVSKDMDLVHKLSDQIFIINNGKIVKSGTKYEIFTDFELLKKYKIEIPKVIAFSKLVFDKKGIKMGYRDDTSDLLKDIYRYK